MGAEGSASLIEDETLAMGTLFAWNIKEAEGGGPDEAAAMGTLFKGKNGFGAGIGCCCIC